jgi:oligosaccharyltransferase complex subunit beta
LTPKILLDYVNAGGNVLLGLSSEAGTSSAISSLLLEFDISLSPDKSSVVVDHFNYDTVSATEKHDVLLLNRPGPLRPDVEDFFGGSGILAVPKPVGQTLGNDSPLLAPILKAPATAYAYNPKEDVQSVEEVFAAGSQLALISAMQARNSARFTVLGSLEMLQDKWFDASVKLPSEKNEKTVNREFARQLTEWTFKEVGVLKVWSIHHHEVATSSKDGANTTQIGEYNPGIYRIKNDVVSLQRLPTVGSPADPDRNSPSRLASMSGRTMSLSRSHRTMLCNSNSRCFRPSTAFRSPLQPRRTTAPSTARPSPRPTNTAFSLSRSTTSGPF